MHEIHRLIEDQIIESLSTFPVVYIAGPRQSGKTTLVQHIASGRMPYTAQYLSFDDLQTRSSAERDPEAFLRSLTGNVILDEIQLVPGLFRPLKIIVDEHRKHKEGGRGKFLLTGSASILALPALSDALVGRMVLHTLPPLSAQELHPESDRNFIDYLFSKPWVYGKIQMDALMSSICNASFPELLQIQDPVLRHRWCNGYINTLLQRDVRTLMEVDKLGSLPNLLQLLATRTGSVLNDSSLSRDSDLNIMTTKKYRLLLEGLFLITSLPAWSSNRGKRLIKSPKIYLSDMTILSYFLNIEISSLKDGNPTLYGQLIENFIAIELSKQLTFCKTQATLYHYRTTSGEEVDFILEGPQHRIIGIEVKAKTQVTARDFRHLDSLKDELGAQFHHGIVFYLGTEIMPFGKNLWAVPISALWENA